MKEAKKRKLPNVASTAEALEALTKEENIKMFEKYKVFSRTEIVARKHIWIETYNKLLEIEANTLNEMVNASIVPPGLEYQQLLASNLTQLVMLKKQAGLSIDKKALDDQKEHLADVTEKIFYVRRNAKEMVKLMAKAEKLDQEERAHLYFEELKPLMQHIRKHVDELECVVSDENWVLPKYREMLFIK